MTNFDSQRLPSDLEKLEAQLQRRGATPVINEVSLNQLFCQHLQSGGSRTRAVLALAAGRAAGLSDAARFPVALSVELLHQASLVHDDIQDQDPIRRGQAAVWQHAGQPTAICLGDDLIACAFEQLADLPAEYLTQLPRLTRLLSRGIGTMAAGQALDCQWRPGSRTSLDEYEQIVRHKSGPLLGLPVAMVLALSEGSDDQVTKVLQGASSIGVAYQLADDWLDREEDKGARLNGYWVIRERGCDHLEAERQLRGLFDAHLDQAKQSVSGLPGYCVGAFNELVHALQRKYPTLKAAA